MYEKITKAVVKIGLKGNQNREREKVCESNVQMYLKVYPKMRQEDLNFHFLKKRNKCFQKAKNLPEGNQKVTKIDSFSIQS